MRRISIVSAIAMMAACGMAHADYGFGQSASFNVNLLTAYGSPTYASADSPSFNVNLMGIRRVWADSNSSGFDWFANTSPQPGTIVTATPVASGSLLELSGGAWIDAVTIPPLGSYVIVVNHGWNGSAADKLPLAQAIHARVPQAYIYAWNWGGATENTVSPANPNGLSTAEDFAPLLECLEGKDSPNKCVSGTKSLIDEVGTALANAHTQGGQLGQTLINMGLTPDAYNIHLIGHSFGGVVAADAAKKLYTRTATPVKQLTTLDTPAMWFPCAISAVDPKTAERVEVIYYQWQWYLALGATGGPTQMNASNVLNLALNPVYYGWLLHYHAVDWYIKSAGLSAFDCFGNSYGFGWSTAVAGSGDGWADNLPTGVRVEEVPEGCTDSIAAGAVVAANAVSKTVDKAKDDLTSAASYVGGQASIVMDGAKSALSFFVPGRGSSPSMMAAASPMRYATTQSTTDANVAAFVRKDVNVPPDAEQMVFDYRFGSVTPGDRIEVAVNGQTELVIDAEVAGVSQTYAMSTPIVVSQYAGQTITLQIALYPGGTQAAQAYINNLRFVAVTLAEDINGDNVIDLKDLLVLSEQWLNTGCAYSNNCSGADINGDGQVDLLDLARLASQW